MTIPENVKRSLLLAVRATGAPVSALPRIDPAPVVTSVTSCAFVVPVALSSACPKRRSRLVLVGLTTDPITSIDPQRLTDVVGAPTTVFP
jgi:hypothetical protein